MTAVAVDEAGRPLEEKVIGVGSEELLGWAAALDAERLWAVEDCRQLTGSLEQQPLSVGEELVRVTIIYIASKPLGATGERTDLSRGLTATPYQVTLGGLGRRRRHNAGRSDESRHSDSTQPPPTDQSR